MVHLRLQHFDANLFNVTVIWSNAEVRHKEGLGTSPHPSPIIDPRIVIQTRAKGQTPLHTNCGDNEDDRDTLIDLDKYF